jgi:hypothetical protein
MRSLLRIAAMAPLLAAAAFAQTQPTYVKQVLASNPDVLLTFSESSGSFMDSVSGLAFAPSSSGSILYRQPSTLLDSTAASLTYDAYLTAPNTSLGNYDWGQPWWAIVDLKPNVNLSGSTVVELFSKGVPNHNLSVTDPGVGLGYEAWLYYNYTAAVPCLTLTSTANEGAPSGLTSCSGLSLPNGFGGTIAFTYDGSGTADGITIYINGIASTGLQRGAGATTAFSMATPSNPLYINGDSTNLIASQGANVHNNEPTVYQAFAMGRGTLSQATVQSLVVHDRFYAQILPAAPASPETIVWDNDGCGDTDNLNSLAMAIRLHQLGYIRLALVNSTDWSDLGAAIYRQMLDQGGLHQVPVSASQGTWTSGQMAPGNGICTAGNLAGYNATYLPRNRQMTDVTGYRTALAAAADGSVQIVLGGAMRGVYDLLISQPDEISSMTGAQLFAAKVTAIHMMSDIGSQGDKNLGEDADGAAYVLAHAGVPVYFYGTNVNFGDTGPGANFSRVQQYPFVATLEYANALTRASWDSWPLLGALDLNLFWNPGTPGTVSVTDVYGATTFSTATNSSQYVATPLANWSGSLIMGSWFFNSLINASPEPPVIP